MSPLPMTEADLHAWVDDCLPVARRAEVDAWLADHPEDAERTRAYRAQNHALRDAFAGVADEVVPERIEAAAATAAVDAATRRPSPPRWSLQRVAAGFAIALLGAAAGWFGHGRWQPAEGLAQAMPLSRQAAVAHVVYSPEVRRPVEIGADQEEQLVKWLSKRLGTTVRPPKLGALGYELIGGRLLPGNQGPVAQFMYHDASGQRLTLYVSTENTGNRDTGFRFAQEGPVNVFYWVDGTFGYALSAGIAKSELARVATAVYDQLERP